MTHVPGELHEIGLPEPVSWLPQTAGWVILGLVLLVAAIGLVMKLRAHRRATRYRREALALLAAIESRIPDELRRPQALAELAVLLKRVALSAYPRQRVASLSGGRWLEFLDRSLGSEPFSRGPGRSLAALAYDPQAAQALTAEEGRTLVALARQWIRGHRASEPAS
jgi:hypothetical protein